MGGVLGDTGELVVIIYNRSCLDLCKMPCLRHLAQKDRQKWLKKTTFLYKKTLANCKMIMYNIAMDDVEVCTFADSTQCFIFEEEM